MVSVAAIFTHGDGFAEKLVCRIEILSLEFDHATVTEGGEMAWESLVHVFEHLASTFEAAFCNSTLNKRLVGGDFFFQGASMRARMRKGYALRAGELSIWATVGEKRFFLLG